MLTLSDIAQAIDAASDDGDEALLRKLCEDCERKLCTAKGEERVFLRYYQSNTYAGIIDSNKIDPNYVWSWKQPDGIQNILLLRQAISEPAFETIHPVFACQIRTNLANRLSNLGRFIAANEQWMRVIDTIPTFAKATASRAQALAYFAGTLYDHSHTSVLLAAARLSFEKALDANAFWESGDRDSVAPDLIKLHGQIASHLNDIGYDYKVDLNRWSLGSEEEERSYRRWCLNERLFLNPLNEAYTDTVAATDVLHLPSHMYRVEEKPRFPSYYNLLKQEYVSARYRLYRAIHEDDPDFLMRDVLMLDNGDGQSLGHYTENLRSAFRSSYAIFDKISLFLNDYFNIGLEPRDVTFRRVWSKQEKRGEFEIRKQFQNYPNLPLRGLYFLSKDLFDKDFTEISEPDAYDLVKLRQQLEHRFLSLQYFVMDESTETHQIISIDEFENKALRLLKMAREALIYMSLAMHREETMRSEASENNDKAGIPLVSQPIDSFRRY